MRLFGWAGKQGLWNDSGPGMAAAYSWLEHNNRMLNVFFAHVLAWLVVGALSLVAYLTVLEVKEFRRNRRMDARRDELGLRRAY
jgi:hypothetical protein